MKLRIGPIFAEFGRPRDQRNVIDIRNVGETNCRVVVGLLAESFDTALSFYILATEYMMRRVKSNIVELRGRNVRRVSAELDSKILKPRPEFVSPKTVIYPGLPAESVGQLFNAAWLACNIRIFGSQGGSLSYHEAIDFVIEKSPSGSPIS